ncbi:hypothetical protein D3C85_691610 [compost metagenome]
MKAINATFKDELTGELVVREIGTMSEFWAYSDKYKAEFCQRWADEKGNAQHDSWLSFVSWEEK